MQFTDLVSTLTIRELFIMIDNIRRLLGLLTVMIVVLLPVQFVISAPVLPPLNKTNTGEQVTGKFIWFDLAATDIDTQKAFYGDVFGWKFRAIGESGDQYTLIMNGDRNIAGLFQVKSREDDKADALWIGLLSVADPNKAVSAAKKAGGSVHTQATTLAQRGTYALLRDPEGALFGVLKSDSGDPPDREMATGDFIWVDLFAKDIEREAAFYQQLAGYEIVEDEDGVKRKFFVAADQYRAAIIPLPEDANRAGWLPYIKVDDVAATLEKVEAAGGQIIVEPDKTLLDGNLAIFVDPQGGIMGVVKWGQP
jgi:predicted enzyme related to lactoylglutathione lyase